MSSEGQSRLQLFVQIEYSHNIAQIFSAVADNIILRCTVVALKLDDERVRWRFITLKASTVQIIFPCGKQACNVNQMLTRQLETESSRSDFAETVRTAGLPGLVI